MTLPILDEYLGQLQHRGRICLQGSYWEAAYKMALGNSSRDDLEVPLILAGWWASDDAQKKERFATHIRYAYKNGQAQALLEYLDELPDDAWYAG